MRKALFLIIFLAPISHHLLLDLGAEAAPAGPLIKHLSSLIKWTRSSPKKTPQVDGNVVEFENGYVVETIVEGNKLGVEPHSIRVSRDGELLAVDSINSNVVRVTPPLSQYSRARLVAGSFQGHAGHVDGKPSDARFNHPKGVTMDDKGNLYVADTLNLAIRKIGESGVTTIAGGKSNVPGYRDGPSEDARFSSDFDVVYVGRTCSLLVVDRGNAALREISLQQEDCDYQDSSISATDVIMVIGAVLVGYASCVFHSGSGPFFFPKMQQSSESKFQDQPTVQKPVTLHVESIKEDPVAGWPSFGRLVTDLSKLALEALGNIFLSLIPIRFNFGWPKRGLTPIKDSLVMPEDNVEPPLMQKHRAPSPHTETLRVSGTATNYTQQKPQKAKSGTLKDPSLSSGKHRKRQDYSEFYGSGEAPQHSQFSTSKSQKERTRHRHREKSGELIFGATGESKPVEMKSVNYGDPKFDHYNIRSKFGTGDHLFHS